jgi:N4 Gp49/Sf6 Gp66 family protein
MAIKDGLARKKQREDGTMSIKHDDAAAAAVATAPRVTLKDIEAAVEAKFLVNGKDLIGNIGCSHLAVEALKSLTVGVVVLKNGYCIVGTSAPASAENYDKALAERLAYENCLRQIWPLMGFALRERLSESDGNVPESEQR